MSLSKTYIFLFFIGFIFLSCSAMANGSKHELYGLSKESFVEWKEIQRQSLGDPQAAINRALAKLNNIPYETVSEHAYGQLLIISIKMNLHRGDEVLAELETAKKTIAAAKQPVFQAELLSAKSRAYLQLQELDEALALIEDALVIFQQVNNDEMIADSYIIRGLVWEQKGESKKALEDLLKAHHMLKSFEDKLEVGHAIAIIANIYSDAGQHEKAIEYYRESFTYIDPDREKYIASILNSNIGSSFSELGQYEEAEGYFQKALETNIELGDEVGKAYTLAKIASIKSKRSNTEAAISTYKQALAVVDKHRDTKMSMNISIALAKEYLRLNELNSAEMYLAKAMTHAKTSGIDESTAEVYLTASAIFEQQLNFEQALAAHKKYTETIVSKHEIDYEKSFSELMVKYDTETKENKNKILQQENLLQQSKIRQKDAQHKYLAIISGLSLLLFIWIVFSLYRQVRLSKRFKSLALTDELTGAPNRRHILEYARRQFELSQEINTPLTIAIIDLDHFKRFNDNYGHDIGDRVLQAFYQATKHSIRTGDRVGRMGGEEWLLVMPGLVINQVSSLFERIKNALNDVSITGLNEETPINFSMGVAEINADDQELRNFLKRADSRLYHAKENGRDQWSA